MYVQDQDGRIIHANRATCELVGKPPEEVVGRLPEELFDPATVERWREQNREILKTGRPIDVEDGWGGRTHLTHKTPVFDAEGKPVGVIGISTDITDRKRAEDELRRRERQLSEAQQIAGVGSWHWDSEAGALTWSTELLPPVRPRAGAGADRDEDARCSSTRTTARASEEAGRAALTGEAPLELDARIVRGDGEIRVLHCRGGVADRPGRLDEPDRRHLRRRHRPPSRRGAAWPRRSGSRARLLRLGRRPRRDHLVARDVPDLRRGPGDLVPTRGTVPEKIVDGGPRRADASRSTRRARAKAATSTRFARIRQPDGELRDVHFRGAMATRPPGARASTSTAPART